MKFFVLILSLVLAGCMASAPVKKTSQVNPEERRCKSLASYISFSEMEAKKKRLLNLIEYVETDCLLIMSSVPQPNRVFGSGVIEHFPTYEVPAVLALAETIDRNRAMTVATRLAKYEYHAAQVYLASKVEDTDKLRAVTLYQEAAIGHQCSAQLRLGWAYYKGTLVPKNLHMSFFWISRAAEPPVSGSFTRYGLVTSELRETLKKEGLASQAGPLQYDLRGFLGGNLGLVSPAVGSGRSLDIECPSRFSLNSFLSRNFTSRVKTEVTPLLAQYLVGQPIPKELTAPSSGQGFSAGTNSIVENKELSPTGTIGRLEAEQKVTQQAILQDTQSPSIRITLTNSDGARGTIAGVATDNTGIAEVLISGQAVAVDSSGRFTTSTFIPSGGIDVQITAYDLQGLSTTEIIRLEREVATQVAKISFDRLDPTSRQVKSNTNAIALIVGVAEYEKTASAEFADRDAQVFYDYANLKLGIPQNRIQTLINDQADEVGLLSSINKWLKRSVKQGQSDVFIFFAGHGLASDDGDTAYLIPYDGTPEFLERTAISRDEVFREVSSVNPRSVSVFLDTCYSGDTRGESRLIAGRPLNIKLQEQSLPKGFTVLTAAGGDQIAKPLKEAQHGMFSYFLMKGMEGDADSNSDNQITAKELHTYVRENVVQQSGGSQVPELQGDAKRVLVRFR